MNRICLTLLLFMVCARAQERTYVLRGAVADSLTGQRIPYATVRIEGTSIGTYTNESGYFVLPQIPDSHKQVVVTSIGFKEKTFDIKVSGTVVTMTFHLPEQPTTMPSVLVSGEYLGNLKPQAPSATVLMPADVQKAAGLLNNDLIQAVTQLPGIVTIGGISSQYYVRGGASDQNLVTIDGIRVYNIFHAFGLFSFIDPIIVRVADMSTGGFQAEYGDRLSSVLAIETKDGDKYSTHAAGSADLLSSDLMVTGPLPFGILSGSTSFLGFFRTSNNKNILRRYFNLDLPFQFFDGFGKFTADWTSTGHISVEFFSTGDQISSASPLDPDFHWRNIGYALSGNYLFGSKFNFQFSISNSIYYAEQLPKSLTYVHYESNNIVDPAFYGDLTYYPSPESQLDFGLLFSFPQYGFTFTNAYGINWDYNVGVVEPDAWARYKWEPIKHLDVELGLRVDIQKNLTYLLGIPHTYLGDPRLTMTYKLGARTSIYAAIGRYHQRVINLNNENDIYTPFDLIVPISDQTVNTDDEEAYHFILGTKFSPIDFSYVTAEAYYKDFTKLVEINRYKVDQNDPDFTTSTGKSYGLDLSTKYDIGLFYIIANYSLSKVTITNEGLTYPPRYDRRHQINLSIGWMPFEKLWVRAHWQYGSGLPYTPLAGYYPELHINPTQWGAFYSSSAESQIVFGAKNSARMSDYHRLDASASYEFRFLGIDLTSQLMLINIYNRKNVFYSNNVDGSVEYSLPFTLNLSLKWKL